MSSLIAGVTFCGERVRLLDSVDVGLKGVLSMGGVRS